MKKTIYYFNNLLRTYNKYRRKLANLRKANKNERRQHILQNHIAKLYEKLMALKMSVKLSTVAASIAIGTLAFAPQTTQGQINFAAPTTNPFGLTDLGYNSNPTLADLDNDGDLDMLAGENYGNFFYFQNIGTATAPVFAPVQTNPFGLTDIGYRSSPTFADLDNDGDLDMLAGENGGNFFYFQNTGTATAPAYAPVQNNPFGLSGIGSRSSPTFADLDNDGDLDMLAGEFLGNFKYFQNTGTATAPVFAPVQNNPFGLSSIGNLSSPTFADLDNDGDLDMLAGEFFGNFFYFQNTGTATAPVFAPVQNNPFGLSDIGNLSSPTFADLDNDGDLDMLAGESGGNFFYFENTTPLCIADQTVAAAQTTICNGASTTINVGSTEAGVNYTLRDDATNAVVGSAVAGTGAAISLPTGSITTTTTYNVYAEKLSAVELTNNNDFVRFNSPFSAYTNAITVESWVNFTSTNPTNFAWAGQSSPNVDNMTTNVWLWHPGTSATFFVNDNGTWRSLNFPAISSTGWHHVATVADATGMYIYYDGVLVANNTQGISSGITNNASSLIELGEDPRFTGSTGRNSNTAFDNFRVWNTSRTATDISSNFQSCLTGNETGLVHYTQMDEGTGTAIASLKGSNGTIFNGITNPWTIGSGACNNTCTLEMTQTVTITVNNSPTTTTAQTNVSCNGGTNGSATVTPTGGTAPYTYLWSNGATTATATGLAANTYNVTVTDANGCTTNVSNITITEPTALTSSISSQTNVVCNGASTGSATVTPTGGTAPYTYLWSNGATTATATGLAANTYNVTVTDANACTTNVSNITITEPAIITGTDVQTACNAFTWIDNNTYTASNNTATFNIVNGATNGCDSLVTLDLTIDNIDNTTSLNVDTITANQAGATYQWLDCNNGNAIIAGATAQSFTPTATGDYAVEITNGSCVDTSACVNVIILGINELALAGINIYPNPISDKIVIDLANANQNTQIAIYSIDGKLVYNNATINSNKLVIDATAWSKGVYFVNITTDKNNNTLKMIKQ